MFNIRTGLSILSLSFLQGLSAQNIPLDSAVHTGVLSNGFTYYIRHNAEPKNRVLLYLVNKVGSILEDDDQQGLAHFMEHMNFNGTTNFPKGELVDYLQKSGVRFGADLNAYTSFDETVYQLPVPSDDPVILQNSFKIMRDWAAEATLDTVEINKERGVILEEERLGRGAQDRMQRQILPTLFNQSLYAKRIPIGSVEILKTFPASAIQRFYHNWYRPDLQALVVVGDIDVKAVETLIKKLFSDLKNPMPEKERIDFSVPLTGRNQFIQATDKEMPVTLLQIVIKHKVEKLITEQNYLQLLRSQLFNLMAAERFAASAQTPNLPYLQSEAKIMDLVKGLDAFQFTVVLKPGLYKEGFKAAWENVEKIKRFGFTEEELKRAKQNYLSSVETSLREKEKTQSASYVKEYQRLFLNQEASPGIDWEYTFAKDHMQQITLVQMQEISREYIRDSDRDIVIMGPEKSKALLPDSSSVYRWVTDLGQQQLTAVADNQHVQELITAVPNRGKVVKRKNIARLGITELTLGNGAKVILKPTDFKNDNIRFAAFSPGGTSIYSNLDYENASAADMVAGFGLKNLNPVQLNQILNGKIVQVRPFINERAQGISGLSTPGDFETALQLIYLSFTSPRKDTALFMNAIAGTREMIRSRYSDPVNVFNDTINQVLGNYNYRRMPPSLKKLDELRLNRMYDIYKERFADADGFTFVFVGNFNVDSILPLIKRWIGSLPAEHKKEHERDLGIEIPIGKMSKKVFRGSENQATVKMVFSGDYIYSPENNLALNAIKEVLAIKIIQHLREDESEVYSPKVQVSFNKYPRSRFAFTISYGCAPANADHLMNDVINEIKVLKKYGPSTEDLNKFKAEYRRVHELQLRQNDFWLDYLVNQYKNMDEPTQILNNIGRLNKLTAAQVKSAAQKWLGGSNEIRFELLPETGQ